MTKETDLKVGMKVYKYLTMDLCRVRYGEVVKINNGWCTVKDELGKNHRFKIKPDYISYWTEYNDIKMVEEMIEKHIVQNMYY